MGRRGEGGECEGNKRQIGFGAAPNRSLFTVLEKRRRCSLRRTRGREESLSAWQWPELRDHMTEPFTVSTQETSRCDLRAGLCLKEAPWQS